MHTAIETAALEGNLRGLSRAASVASDASDASDAGRGEDAHGGGGGGCAMYEVGIVV